MATRAQLLGALNANAHPARTKLLAALNANAHPAASPSLGTDVLHGAEDFGKGVLASGAGTARGAMQLVGLGKDVPKVLELRAPNDLAGHLGSFAGNAAQFVGAQFIPGADVVKDAALARDVPEALADAANVAAQSGAFSLLQPARTEAGHLENAAIGAGLGFASDALSPLAHLTKEALRSAPDIPIGVTDAAKRDAVAIARKYGIPLTLHDVTDGSFARGVAGVLGALPFAGASKAAARTAAGFTRAAARLAGLDTDHVTESAISGQFDRLGKAIDDLFRGRTIALAPEDNAALNAAVQDARDTGTQDAARNVATLVQKVRAHVGRNNLISGERFNAVRTELLPKYRDSDSRTVRDAARTVRSVLMDAASRDLPEGSLARLRALNAEWNNLHVLQDAIIKRGAGAAGHVQPTALWALTHGKIPGTPEMKELATLGQVLLHGGSGQWLDRYLTMYMPAEAALRALRGGLEAGAAGAGAGAAVLFPHVVAPLAGAAALGATAGRIATSDAFTHSAAHIAADALQKMEPELRAAMKIVPPAFATHLQDQPLQVTVHPRNTPAGQADLKRDRGILAARHAFSGA